MFYQDRIYGQTEITEPVILELINCPTLQRLKEIDQIGYGEPHFPGTAHSRFEHSVAVYLLLTQYGAPPEERIAGLIHDVSHSAFSHCIDYVLNAGSEKEQAHQDNIFESFVRRSEIPGILGKYELDIEYILDDANFPLKEKELPDLCADRIDYSLRTAIMYKELEPDEARAILEYLVAEDGEWVFRDFASAKRFAELFRKLNTLYYSGMPSAVMFRTVGDYLRHALQKGYLAESDLYGTDRNVLSKIAGFHERDDRLSLLFTRMNNKIGYRNDPEDYDAEVYCKSRVVDPLYKVGKKPKKISETNMNWRLVLEKEMGPKVYYLKFDR
jgi:uncharacterized protein